MAKLADFKIKRSNNAGESVDYSLRCTVLSDGNFRISIPPELVEVAENHKKLCEGAMLYQPRVDSDHVVEHKDLRHLKKMVEGLVESHLSTEVIEELIVIYAYGSNTRYVKTDEEELRLCKCHHCETVEGEWVGKDWTFSAFSTEVYAGVANKITHFRKDGDSVFAYERPSSEQIKLLGYHGKALRCANIKFPSNYDLRGGYDKRDIQELPYTEDNAKFFHDILLGICALSEKMDLMLRKENIALSIEGLTNNLLPSHEEITEESLYE